MKEKITLSLDQHENARHGEEIFPLQKYVTPLWKEYPYVAAHWHEEAEFTWIRSGACVYHIDLCDYPVQEGDMILLPPRILHSVRFFPEGPHDVGVLCVSPGLSWNGRIRCL